MEILLWLVPAVAATVLAMLWVAWVGRDGRGEVDRDVAVERMGRALAKELPAGVRRTPSRGTSPAQARERSTGIAVRPSAGPTPGEATARATRRAS